LPPGGVISHPGGVILPPGGVILPPWGVISHPGGVISSPGVSYRPPGVSYRPPGVSYRSPGVSYRPPGVSYRPRGVISPFAGVSRRSPRVSYCPPPRCHIRPPPGRRIGASGRAFSRPTAPASRSARIAFSQLSRPFAAGPANASTFTPTPSCTPASTSKVTLAGFAPLLLRLLPFYLLSGCYFCFRWFYFSAYAQSWPHFYSCFYANSPLFHFHSPRLPLLPLLPPHLQRL